MATTKIADVIVPEIFQKYVIQRIREKNELIDSGIVASNAAYDILAKKGGTTINMPYWEDLTGEDEILSDSRALTPGKITSGQDVARLQARGRAWSVNDLAMALSGDDPMGAIASLVAGYWKKIDQKILIASLNGVFNAANMGGHILDVSKDDSTGFKVGGEVMIDAATLLGDRADLLTAYCMHSHVFAQLQKNNLIETVEDSDAKVKIHTYMGKRVLKDDTMPVENCTSGGGKKYTTYLFGQGAFAHGEGNAPVAAETDRDSLAGDDILINRRHFVLHPRGIKWTDASVAEAFPSNIELANGSNWTRVYEPKEIRMVKLVTNG